MFSRFFFSIFFSFCFFVDHQSTMISNSNLVIEIHMIRCIIHCCSLTIVLFLFFVLFIFLIIFFWKNNYFFFAWIFFEQNRFISSLLHFVSFIEPLKFSFLQQLNYDLIMIGIWFSMFSLETSLFFVLKKWFWFGFFFKKITFLFSFSFNEKWFLI